MSAPQESADGGQRGRATPFGRASTGAPLRIDVGCLGLAPLEVMLGLVEHLVKTENGVVTQADIRSAVDAEIVVRVAAGD